MAVILRLWGALGRVLESAAGREVLGQGLSRLCRTGRGGARLAQLLGALPLPVMALGVGAALLAAALAPDETARLLAALALLPEGLWWAVATFVAALFGLRLQAREQAFAQELQMPLPPPVLEADSGGDAALALRLGDSVTRDNPALVLCRTALDGAGDDATALKES